MACSVDSVIDVQYLPSLLYPGSNQCVEITCRENVVPLRLVTVCEEQNPPLQANFAVVQVGVRRFWVFLTTLCRARRARGQPVSHPGDFPRGCGTAAGVPICLKSAAKPCRVRSGVEARQRPAQGLLAKPSARPHRPTRHIPPPQGFQGRLRMLWCPRMLIG